MHSTEKVIKIEAFVEANLGIQSLVVFKLEKKMLKLT